MVVGDRSAGAASARVIIGHVRTALVVFCRIGIGIDVVRALQLTRGWCSTASYSICWRRERVVRRALFCRVARDGCRVLKVSSGRPGSKSKQKRSHGSLRESCYRAIGRTVAATYKSKPSSLRHRDEGCTTKSIIHEMSVDGIVGPIVG